MEGKHFGLYRQVFVICGFLCYACSFLHWPGRGEDFQIFSPWAKLPIQTWGIFYHKIVLLLHGGIT